MWGRALLNVEDDEHGEAPVPGRCPIHLLQHYHQQHSDTLTAWAADGEGKAPDAPSSSSALCSTPPALSLVPSSPPTPLCVVGVERRARPAPSSSYKSLAGCHWRTQSGVLMLQLGETLLNLPIACHWPWPGLFVSGTL
ncbi:hypothetical protein WMY93_018158 [Mugilogobius chulae]|uniref:Uncharacterized protein n=1 Tax=Mugilogobius chulae TaxID=88201 RepID=A0AAW0NVB9_9GOBI